MGAGILAVLGLNAWDLAILALFLAGTLVAGFLVSRGIRKEADFFVGGRKLGRTLQFFLNFGNSTDSTGAVQVATAVYQRGAGGIWVGGFQTLFITPFFWFTQPWWRRARLLTMGDLFIDRFNSKAVASTYAVFSIFIALLAMGNGNFYTFKVAQAMMTKPQAEYTRADHDHVREYHEFRAMRSRIEAGELNVQNSERFKYLDNRSKRGELASVISYVRPLPFYLAYSTIVGIYIVLGGLRAAAITDAIQGLLILVMSVLLIPIGLRRIGGLHGLHQIVPANWFNVGGENAWYVILAITFGSLVQIVGLLHNMSTAGSATNEDTARFGMITGGFTKRLVLIAWMLCGLIAVAVLGGKQGLSDPDNAWGALSKELLAPGLLGLMLSGMLLGHMPSVGVYAVAVSGLITRNLYQPLVRGKPEEHYLRIGQISIVVVLLIAVMFAMCASDVISAYTLLVTFNTFFGAAVFLTIFWRRLTARAILAGAVVWVIVMGIIPWGLPRIPQFRRQGNLLTETFQYTRGGRVMLPRSVYFDSVARIDPSNPSSALEGLGRFNVENYALHLLGVPVRKFESAAMETARWGFDGLFPFVLLMALSWMSKPTELPRADRFFAKMRTPVAPTPQADREEVALSYSNPRRFIETKLIRESQWQFTKWTLKDAAGFGGCWAIVIGILLLLWAVLRAGA